ncbi:non-hydrolyzing UDP-N-acetylglucosamine 2-epimerase [Lacihabitans soyangensis]|jgi:UDP-N-acetylglucosamine 2-epimerase (non-hydrolysing)|uniref:UDP-N-acetylglucosamine 2-epimerase (Non-hydrolyzing) n=1 Tax=Lacihabitans soyangensis TaxID=869394 RepID=A0AAE3KSB0_9BACT|nr:UDP-N-acetylglucosamine 2-epimerase (non-hydrolyzing) [Lacihabitans soyangensis]MCP9762908.1 UDP-N-acetylglucosamine 2-epimerase (non-hydrolyzing) [Lacihabitans soyangensis]
MIKVMTIVGTRPEIIKLSQVIKLIDKHCEHILVHTGQNYDFELNEIFFEQLGVRKPDFFLNAARPSSSETIGEVIIKTDKLLAEILPDAVLIYGDTNSCLSVIPAKKRKIPIFHMEAGNRCFDQRVPEEVNRKIVDHLSDINMPLSDHARQYLLREGLKPETVIKTGSPMKEVINANFDAILKSNILELENLEKNGYFLVSIHREENVDSDVNFSDLLSTIKGLSKYFNKKIIISTHPRTRKKLEEINYTDANALISFAKPFGFHEYHKLQMNAFCVISDSGTVTEESSILKFPSITIRQAHERPEGMDEGTLIMSGLKYDRVLESIKIVTNPVRKEIKIVSDYDVDNVSEKVLRIIVSYTDYVNRTVWNKNSVL